MTVKKTTASATPITDKARKAAIAEIQNRLDGKAPAPAKGKAKAKTAKTAKPPVAKPKRLSALDAAAQVLAKSAKPLRAKELIAEMEAKNLWKSPGGKTPEATLYAAMVREIGEKKNASRFKKVERGLFAAGKGA